MPKNKLFNFLPRFIEIIPLHLKNCDEGGGSQGSGGVSGGGDTMMPGGVVLSVGSGGVVGIVL